LLDQQDKFSQPFAFSDYSDITQEEAFFLQRGKNLYSIWAQLTRHTEIWASKSHDSNSVFS